MMPSDSVQVQRLHPILADLRFEFAGLPPAITMWLSPSCLSKRKRAASPCFLRGRRQMLDQLVVKTDSFRTRMGTK
jgi:hypothetical protein